MMGFKWLVFNLDRFLTAIFLSKQTFLKTFSDPNFHCFSGGPLVTKEDRPFALIHQVLSVCEL